MAAKHVPLDEATYVVVDLETTGLDHRSERIIEIGAVKMVGGSPTETFEQLVNPQRVIPPKIVKLTGITNGMVYGAPDIADVLPAFARFAADAVLVAHNAPFDISFLNSAARSTGHKAFRNSVLDTKLISQKLNPLLGFYRLANLAEHFRVPHRPCHRALADARATAGVFSHLLGIMRTRGLATTGAALEFFYPKERYDFSNKRKLAANLPRSSGVYLMKDRRGGVLYVGKAKDLNKRVRSYFYNGPKTEKQLALLTEINSIDHIATGTEIGALLLESKLIKAHRPPYNIRGKRYRRYPFVHIDYEDEFPTPKIVRKVEGGGFHYGPFPNAADLELLVEVTKDLYGLKQCAHAIGPKTRKDPCFYYQVNRCSGPCSGAITHDEYQERLVAVTDALEGRPERLRRELIRRRDACASELHFERAALFQRSLASLERTTKIIDGIRNAKANLDFLLIEELGERRRVYMVASGQLTSCVDIADGSKKDIAQLQKKLSTTYFTAANDQNRITPEHIENLSLLSGYFQNRPVVKVNILDSPGATLQEARRHLNFRQPCPST